MMHFGYKPDFQRLGEHSKALYSALPIAKDSSMNFGQAQEAFAKSSLKGDSHLEALLMQATKGDCNVPRPKGMFEAKAKAEHDNWMKLSGMNQASAKDEFMRVAAAKGLKF